MRVAIIGSGAVAGLAASWLEEPPLLCARTPVDAFTLTGDGRGGSETRTVPVHVVAAPEQAQPVDWVLLTVKAQDTPSTLPWLDALVGPETVVVVLQNGVDHVERIQPLVGAAQVLPALVLASAERTGPGAITHYIGNMLVVPESPAAQRLGELFGKRVLVKQDPDFRTAAWRKLMVNIGSNPITALTRRRCEVLQLPEIQDLCRALLRETVAVGVAVGAKLDESDVDKVMRTYQSYPDDNGTSMYYDRMAGRPLEHDLLSGAVVRAAAEHQIAVPANLAVWALSRTCA